MTLGALKQALASIQKLIKLKESLLCKYKMDSAELKEGTSTHYAAPDHAFAKVATWLNRILFHVRKLLDIRTNKQKASKDKDGLELLPQVMKIKKDMLKSLVVDAEEHCSSILRLSKVAMVILEATKNKKGANEVETVKDEKRVSQAKLETLAERAKKMQDDANYESLMKQIDDAKAWYADYEKIKNLQNDDSLRTELVKPSDHVKSLLDQVEQLIARKAEQKLETRQGVTKTIQKIQKFT